MLLKSADDKESQITVLDNLLNHENIPATKKQKIEKELRNLNHGIATEKQAAYEINFHFGASKNLMVLHDLRIEVNGRVAQIDHLLINRFCEIYVLETKTFSTGMSINKQGEFSISYDGREIGIPSPVEQNTRHISVLRDAFKLIGLPKRLGITIQPTFHPVVLVSQKAIINRPKSSEINLDSIIKLDQFFSWYNKKIDSTKPSDAIGIFKLCSSNTIESLGKKLAKLHKPGRVDYIRKFDLVDHLLNKITAENSVTTSSLSDTTAKVNKEVGNYFCASCQNSIADVVAKFCWNNKSRFAGKAYCRTCQNKF